MLNESNITFKEQFQNVFKLRSKMHVFQKKKILWWLVGKDLRIFKVFRNMYERDGQAWIIGRWQPLFNSPYIIHRIYWALLTKEKRSQTWQYVNWTIFRKLWWWWSLMVKHQWYSCILFEYSYAHIAIGEIPSGGTFAGKLNIFLYKENFTQPPQNGWWRILKWIKGFWMRIVQVLLPTLCSSTLKPQPCSNAFHLFSE